MRSNRCRSYLGEYVTYRSILCRRGFLTEFPERRDFMGVNTLTRYQLTNKNGVSIIVYCPGPNKKQKELRNATKVTENVHAPRAFVPCDLSLSTRLPSRTELDPRPPIPNCWFDSSAPS
jgi:hypothetical protein